MADATAPSTKQIGIRTLVINAMFSIFLALVVFVVGTYFFLVPRMLDQQRRIELLEQQVAELQGGEDDSGEGEAEEGIEPTAAQPEAAAPAAQPATAKPGADAGR